MDKVYLAVTYINHYPETKAVFATQELAEAFAKEVNGEHGQWFGVEEWPIKHGYDDTDVRRFQPFGDDY